jgi:two-component system, OmpR family, sensor histidine kinase KdpD
MQATRPKRDRVRGPRTGLGYAVALGGTSLATAGLLLVRGRVSITNVVLVYLIVVVAAAATGGRGPGVVAVVLGFLAFDLLFIPPYYHLVAHDKQNYLSLGVYLLVALVVSALVAAREQRRIQAERREQEAQTLYELSASLVTQGGLGQMLASVARTVRSQFDLAGCAIVLRAEDGSVRVAAADGEVPEGLRQPTAPAGLVGGEAGVLAGMPASEPAPGPLLPGQSLAMPLGGSGQPVGVLVVVAGGPEAGSFGPTEQRLLATFANQAALAVHKAEQDEQLARARALEATDRLRTALLNSVSHDLRTPLASVLASVGSLLDPEVHWPADQRHEFLCTIDRESRRLSHLVSNLLDMSRIQAGAVDPKLVDTWLSEVVGPVVRRARAVPSRQVIDVDVPESLPSVLVDPVRLDQVLTNLLDNARRYAGDGLVQVVGRSVGGHVELRVLDHGPGVPAAERERIFNQFYRVEPASRSAAGNGTGLGLSICRGLVEAMGGHVWVETAPGGGAAFVIRLPAVQPGP